MNAAPTINPGFPVFSGAPPEPTPALTFANHVVPEPDANGEFATPADGAKFMASLGIPQVPLSGPTDRRFSHPGKNPAINGKKWQEKASTNSAQIDAWAKKYPGCNFGSLAKLQVGGFYVLETDSTDLAQKYAQETGNQFQSGLVIESSAPDRNHRWYRQSEVSLKESGNIGQEDGRGFSLRCDDEQAVSPGSIHANGKQYRVVSEACSSPTVQPFAELQWLKTQKPRSPRQPSEAHEEKTLIPPGGHHEALLKELGHLIHRGYSRESAYQALLLWASEWLESPGHGEPLKDHVRKMVDSADGWERGTPLTSEEVGSKAETDVAGRDGLKLDFVPLSQIDAEIQEWLWENRIPKNALTNLSGDSDKGKSMTLYDILARISSGADFPDGAKNPFEGQPKKVVLLFSEGSLKTTVKPRMMVMGANMDNVITLKSVSHKGEKDATKRQFYLETDLSLLRNALQENPEIAVVGFDPITNYLGDDCNMNHSQDVRRVLTPLGELAEECGVTIVSIIHFSKNTAMSAIHRTGGAAALVEVPRAAWCCMDDDDPENKGGFVFVRIKNNLGKRIGGLRYRIEEAFVSIKGKQASVPQLVWGGTTEKTADDLLSLQNNPEAKGMAKARSWLNETFKDDFARKSSTVFSAAAAVGITEDCLKKARQSLRMESKKLEWSWYIRRHQDQSQPWNVSTDLEGASNTEDIEVPF